MRLEVLKAGNVCFTGLWTGAADAAPCARAFPLGSPPQCGASRSVAAIKAGFVAQVGRRKQTAA